MKKILSIILVFLTITPLWSQQLLIDKIPQGAIEIIELRTEFSRTYKNPDGSYTAIINSFTNEANIQLQNNGQILGSYKSIWVNGGLHGASSDLQAGISKLNNFVYRATIRWSTSIIPTNSTINSAIFDITSTAESGQYISYSVKSLVSDPNTTSDIALWNDCGNGSEYDSFFNENGGAQIDEFGNNYSFNYDLQSKLNLGWFAVGLQNNSEDDANRFITFGSSALIINYDPPSNFAYNFTLSPSSYNSPSTGGYISVNVNCANCIDNFLIYEAVSNFYWIKITPGISFTPGHFSVTIDPNYTGETRTGTVTIRETSGYDKGNPTTFVVTQSSEPPILLMSDVTHWGAPSQGGKQTVNLSINGPHFNYKYKLLSSNSQWLKVPDGGVFTAENRAVFEMNALPNFSGSARSGHVKINQYPYGVPDNFIFITVSQDIATTCILPDQTIAGSQSYFASNYITVNTFDVSDAGSVPTLTLVAGNSIKLNPGFKASSSLENKFHAYINSDLITSTTFSATEANTDNLGKIKNYLAIEQYKPDKFELAQNHPNPFNPITTLKYALKEDVNVRLKIYNIIGQEVRTLVNEKQTAGFKSAIWDGKNNFGIQVPSGIYIYRLEAGQFVKSRKMLLLK